MAEILNEKFVVEAVPCECLVDVTHAEDGAERRTLRIRENRDVIFHYAYMPKEGLVRIDAETGSVTSRNLLGELLAIRIGDTNGLMNFFSEYGFFTPLPGSAFMSYDFDVLFLILRRIQTTLHLMNLTQEPYVQYKRMLHMISWLVFSDRVTLNGLGTDTPQLETCIHAYKDEMSRNVRQSYSVDPFDPASYSDTQASKIQVVDSILGETIQVDLFEFERSAAGAQMMSDYIQSDVLLSKYTSGLLYLYHNDCDDNLRKVIDYYYHVTTEIGEILRSEEGVTFDCPDGEFDSRFGKKLRAATIDVAKIIIKEELDYAINVIYPSYDIETMSASWKIPDLYSALFFSIFYMRPEVEIYRKCENPNCERYFLISTTNSKRKYCSEECMNAMQQRKYRRRKKKASAEADA